MNDIDERFKQMLQSQKICELFMEHLIVHSLINAGFNIAHEILSNSYQLSTTT